MEELGHMAGAFDEYGFAMPSEDHPSVLFLDDEESNRSHSYRLAGRRSYELFKFADKLFSPQPSESVVKAWGEVCEGWNRQTAPSPLKVGAGVLCSRSMYNNPEYGQHTHTHHDVWTCVFCAL